MVCEVNSLYKFQNFFASFASDETRQCAQEATTQAVQIQVQTVAYLGGAMPPPPRAPPRKVRKHFLTRYTVRNKQKLLFLYLTFQG